MKNKVHKIKVVDFPDVTGRLTLAEAAEKVDLHPNTLRYYVKVGKIGCIRKGSQYHFSKDDLLPIFKTVTASPHNAQNSDAIE